MELLELRCPPFSTQKEAETIQYTTIKAALSQRLKPPYFMQKEEAARTLEANRTAFVTCYRMKRLPPVQNRERRVADLGEVAVQWLSAGYDFPHLVP
jgi:hypothetical protein